MKRWAIPEDDEEIVSAEGGLIGAALTTPPWSILTTILEPTPLAPWVNRIPIETITSHDPAGQLGRPDVAFVAAPNNPWCASDLLSFLRQADGIPSPAVPAVWTDFNVTPATGYGGGRPQQLSRPASGMASATSHLLQDGQWKQRFEELLQYRLGHGHVLVPHLYPPNQKLSKWVKRQRYQRRLKERGLQSTLTDEREQLLVDVGFVWNSHGATWQEHFESYERFVMVHGADCGVPLDYSPDPSLNTWCKHQRRQYKFAKAGLPSTITPGRIAKLNSVGFSWNPRNLSRG